ncbi:UrcA family protein [Porphyrobacter sp. GA68]|uniref:UrcA family protein n=1 Tax=Porphyrobacter sp. GA68 TaxID=2883480 RepID=UPI001D191F9F|nr:UrcA family protein [Porphyrobacter sp. GA68]
MNTLLGLAAATAALMAVAPAVAAPEEMRQINVQYGDLDLASPEGRKVLERRLTNAAREVCGIDDQRTGSRIRKPQETHCYRQARATAMQRYAVVIERDQLGG